MTIFDNAKEVIINNKVVKKIEISGGGVIYEKEKQPTSITCDTSSANVNVNSNITISGRLTSNGNILVRKTIKIYNGTTLLNTVATDSNGRYRVTQNLNCKGTWEIKAIFEGDDTYEICTSPAKYVTVNGYNPTYSCTLSDTELTVGQTCTLNGYINVPGAYLQINVKGSSAVGTTPSGRGLVVNNDGTFSWDFTAKTVGNWYITILFRGNCTYNQLYFVKVVDFTISE